MIRRQYRYFFYSVVVPCQQSNQIILTYLRFCCIFPEDEKVIEAAIKLGDWIVCQPETTNKEKAIIQEVQAALRKLPEVTLDLSADYEFLATSIELENWDGKEPIPKGEERSWSVSYGQVQDTNGEICAIVEIFNMFHPYPRITLRRVSWQ